MKALRGIILPLRHFNSKKYGEKASMINVFYMKNSPPGNYNRDAFPFNIPFHPGQGPEIIYPDGPLEPEEDPGDEPDAFTDGIEGLRVNPESLSIFKLLKMTTFKELC